MFECGSNTPPKYSFHTVTVIHITRIIDKFFFKVEEDLIEGPLSCYGYKGYKLHVDYVQNDETFFSHEELTIAYILLHNL